MHVALAGPVNEVSTRENEQLHQFAKGVQNRLTSRQARRMDKSLANRLAKRSAVGDARLPRRRPVDVNRFEPFVESSPLAQLPDWMARRSCAHRHRLSAQHASRGHRR
jgi:hypothetical protein